MTPEVQRIVDAHVRAERRRIAAELRKAAKLCEWSPQGPLHAWGMRTGLEVAAERLEAQADADGGGA